jgi:predicted ATP-dependent protease
MKIIPIEKIEDAIPFIFNESKKKENRNFKSVINQKTRKR